MNPFSSFFRRNKVLIFFRDKDEKNQENHAKSIFYSCTFAEVKI